MKLRRRRDEYFAEANREAQKSLLYINGPKFKTVGCVAVYQGKVIARGHSSLDNNYLQTRFNKICGKKPNKPYFLHAEVHCISKIYNDKSIDWEEVELYVYRLIKTRDFGCAKPSRITTALLRHLGIRNIYYSGANSMVHEFLEY